MTNRHSIAVALLRIYPPAWRAEYGSELLEILQARPLTPLIVADVIWNGLKQRTRSLEPATILGLASLLVIVTGFALTPTAYGKAWMAMVRPSNMTFPTVTVTFMASDIYAILLVTCGAWTYFRTGAGPRDAGYAAIRMSLIAGAPVIIFAALAALGAVDLTRATSASGAPILAGTRPSAVTVSVLSLIVAPLTRLFESWLWGWLGAFIACRQSRRVRKPA
jgi:hypothetical protein